MALTEGGKFVMLFLSEEVKVVVLFLSEEVKEEAKVGGGNLFIGEVKVFVVFLSMKVVLLEVNFVVLLLSKEVLLLGEEPVFSVLLLSATQGGAASCLGKRGGQQKRMGRYWIRFIVIMSITMVIHRCWGRIVAQKHIEIWYKCVR